MKIKSNSLLTLTLISASMLTPFSVDAVTDKEMEEARAITAMAYLRYANDGSGYLDDLSAPKSIADLQKNLKKQETENLKGFLSISTPKDYASWDKAKLVEYWSSTFFNSPGLIEKGKLARARVKKRVGDLKISAPSKDNPEIAKTEASQEKKAPETQPAPAVQEVSPETMAFADSIESVTEELEATLENEPPVKKNSNNTWVYIMVLCILVAIVLALVIFASNVMKKTGAIAGQSSGIDSKLRDEYNKKEEEAREKFADTLAAKNKELSELHQRCLDLEKELSSRIKENEAAKAMLASLKEELKNKESVSGETQSTSRPAEAINSPTKEISAPGVKSIYLGRANNRGLFVRADRKLNIGHSIYRLETSDGYSGTFHVAEDPTVWEMALLTPKDSLMGACTGKDLESTDGYTRIVTESAGTAIFEGGCWKVIRKAKIRYE